jgi:hypothetical protein
LAGFYNPLGVLLIGGLHGLPLLLYVLQNGSVLPPDVAVSVAVVAGWWVLVTGRLLCAAVELWFVWSHVCWMCGDDGGGGDDDEDGSKTK